MNIKTIISILFIFCLIFVVNAENSIPESLEVYGKIETKRKGNLITILFNNKPSKKKYFIIENNRIIGTANILSLINNSSGKYKIRAIANYNVWIIQAYLFISILAAFILIQVNANSIVKMLKDISRVTREVASGGKATFRVFSLEKEFASIEYDLMEMAWEIEEHRKNLETKVDERTSELQTALSDLKVRDDQMQKQLDMASVIQRSILPGEINDWNELKFSVRYAAMEKIGGDFYDVHQLKDDKLGIMIADVSGHGIPAALVTTMAKISFGNAGSKFDSPRRIFQEVNQNILDHVKTQDYMTCFMVSIDDEYNVVYSNASHQKAILVRTDTNQLELLDTNGLFIGAIEGARDSYEEKTTKLNYGDRIVLYTDGIPESLNKERKEYSNDRFEEIVLKNKNLPLEDFTNELMEDVQNFIGNAQVEDDTTLLVIELARDEAVDLIKTINKLINEHKTLEAIELLEEGLSKYPDNQKILYNLSKNYFRLNRYDDAIVHIEKYLNNDKRNKYAYYICGASYYQVDEFKYSIDSFEKALEIDLNFGKALFAMGMAYKKLKDKEQAKKIFNRVINIDSDNKMALFELKLLLEEE